jgi:hypothetical protein
MRSRICSVALLLLAVPAAAQDPPSATWEPWLGCWELTLDSVRDLPAARSRSGAGNAPGAVRPRVCVTPEGDGGARFVTTIAGQPPAEYTTVPDGRDRPLEDGDCRGTQRAEWSSDGLRIFTRADLTCDSDPAPRRLSGISLFASNGTWLDIQAINVGGREQVRVRRYYRAEGEAEPTRSFLSASVLMTDDVKEASAKVAALALEAALIESNAGFNLTASTVINLDDAGVPGRVIDLMVALSYPDRFVVERSRAGGGGGFANDPFMLGWAFGYPVWYDDYFYSPYYYMPFGYSSYAFRGYGSPYFGDVIAVNPDAGPRPSGTGRAVDGQGYTRVRTREATTADGQSGGARTSAARPDSSSGSAGTSSTSSTASSGGGYSGGGSSGGDTGRTAQPR